MNTRIRRSILSLFLLFAMLSTFVLPAWGSPAQINASSLIQSLPIENHVQGNLSRDDCFGKANVIVFGSFIGGNTTNFFSKYH
jgi:hypothetical protein